MELGDFAVRIKDIIYEEDFFTSLGKSLLPRSLQTVANAGPAYAAPTDVELAKVAAEKFGDNPESELPGVLGWLTPQQQKALVDIKEKEARKKERQQQRTKQAKGTQRLAKDVFGATAAQPAPSTKKSAPTASTPRPQQVKMASGQYITKYGNDWYDEQGQRITIPGDIERLERAASGPSGQTQMSTTKHVPVDLPGYKGKRK